MALSLDRYHGAGNAFLVASADLSAPWSAFAVENCEREGVDGVLVLEPHDGDPPRVEMALYQPDGGTAEMCGNGARCVAAWTADRLGLESGEEILIETPAGVRPTTVGDDDAEIGMGEVRFDPESVPLAREEPLVAEEVEGYEVTAVNTGVPHAVTFVEDVEAVDLEEMAPPIRHSEVFPEGANVTLAAGSGKRFYQRTFERGVEGETLACGTGAVAVLAVARRLGLSDETRATVSPPGGDLVVTVDEDGEATLRGPVTYDGRVECPVPDTGTAVE
ncbi:diaminopimelate epimerase [Natronorarus salvus]|uniref:diaminopimelate epimerase n=1 Tax=Natronorarus salvus TaxID=3117733 RepID=UPI002F266D90